MLPMHLLLGVIVGATARRAHAVGLAALGMIVSLLWGVLLVVTDIGGAHTLAGGTALAFANFTAGAALGLAIGVVVRDVQASLRRRRHA
jgi:hypothetical protein